MSITQIFTATKQQAGFFPTLQLSSDRARASVQRTKEATKWISTSILARVCNGWFLASMGLQIYRTVLQRHRSLDIQSKVLIKCCCKTNTLRKSNVWSELRKLQLTGSLSPSAKWYATDTARVCFSDGYSYHEFGTNNGVTPGNRGPFPQR